jgi:hypothetical protein
MIEFPFRAVVNNPNDNMAKRIIWVSLSNIVSAFADKTIGTKIKSRYQEKFLIALAHTINEHDFSKDTIPGQAVLDMKGISNYIHPGVGRSTNDPKDYVLRSYRGNVSAYLKRSKAVSPPVCNMRCVIYTTSAYMQDPDINETPGEGDRIIKEDPSHVLVAILSDIQGYQAVLSPHRFVCNLGGGNNLHLQMTADQIREQAKEIAENVDGWSVISD